MGRQNETNRSAGGLNERLILELPRGANSRIVTLRRSRRKKNRFLWKCLFEYIGTESKWKINRKKDEKQRRRTGRQQEMQKDATEA